jgi:hypothetical protein
MNLTFFDKALIIIFGALVLFVVIPMAVNYQIKANRCYEKSNHSFVQTSKGWSCLEFKKESE